MLNIETMCELANVTIASDLSSLQCHLMAGDYLKYKAI